MEILKFKYYPENTIKELIEAGYSVKVNKDMSKYYYEVDQYIIEISEQADGRN